MLEELKGLERINSLVVAIGVCMPFIVLIVLILIY